MSTTFFDIFKKFFILFYQTNVRLYSALIIQFSKFERMFMTVKWEKTVVFKWGVPKTRTYVLFFRKPIS